MTTLDKCADQLRELLDLPTENLFLRPLLRQINILWVISEDGAILVAFEEFASEDPIIRDVNEPTILPRKLIVTPRPKKLGHGAMLNGAPGRIAGEICFEANRTGEYTWQINNQSGRYGRGCGRTPEQLNAATNEFVKRNINLEEQFYRD